MQLCVALDLPDQAANLALVKKLQAYDIWLKVGLRSYVRDGKAFLEAIKTINPNFKIFLDLKLYDIPNTMADTAEEIGKLGVEMFNIHASAGPTAMKAVMERLGSEKRPLVLAVTALTSFDNEEFESIYQVPLAQKATAFAQMSAEAGLDGVVCSSHESMMIKEATKDDFITLTPGIRPSGSDVGDQKRIATPEWAKTQNIDFIVVGRPIYKAEDPAAVTERILSTIS